MFLLKNFHKNFICLLFIFLFFFNLSWKGLFNFCLNEQFYMIFLVILIFFLGYLSSKGMNIFLEMLILLSILFFIMKNFFFMYIFLEFCLIPVIFMIFFFGLQPEKISALYYFFFYTVFSGYFIIFFFSNFNIFLNIVMMKEKSSILLFFLSLGFMVKLPLFSFHFWLPLAHTEAPSLGSVVLAGLLLKLGGFGIIFIMSIFFLFWKFFIFFLSFLGSVLSTIICSFQSDGKVLIAYSSVTHMNFGFFCLLFFFINAKFLNFFMMLTHGVVSSLMFWSFGIIYYLNFSRSLYFINNFQFYVFIFLSIIYLSNFGFPPILSCYQEFFFFFSIYSYSKWFLFFFIFYFVMLMYYNIFFSLNLLFKSKNFFIFFSENYMFFFFSIFMFNYYLINLL